MEVAGDLERLARAAEPTLKCLQVWGREDAGDDGLPRLLAGEERGKNAEE